MVETGRFITLEGLEGVGKTTSIATIEARLRAAGREVVVTREPGGTPIGEALRALVLDPAQSIEAMTELCLVVAARLEHLRRVIEPALAAGRWVLSDRYLDASYAYQGGGRRLGAERVAAVHRALGVERLPDLTVWIDMPPAAGLARTALRGDTDRVEREPLEFFERAREGYAARVEADPARFRVLRVASDESRVAVQGRLAALMDEWLARTVSSDDD